MGKWSNRGTHDSSSERERMLQHPRQHMPGSNAYEQTNFAKNGPQMIGLIARKSPSVNGPSEEEIKEGQQRMEGKQVRKHGDCGEDFERCIKNILDEFLKNSCDEKVCIIYNGVVSIVNMKICFPILIFNPHSPSQRKKYPFYYIWNVINLF